MNWGELQMKAKSLVWRVSRFQLAEIEEQASRGKGELAGLSRFELAETTRLYEKERENRQFT